MTLNNLLQHATIRDIDHNERDEHLIEIFHLAQEDLISIRENDRVIDRTFEAAKTLDRRLRQAKVNSSIIPAQFTIENLALMIDDGSYNSSPPIRATSTALKRKYKSELLDRIGKGLNPPYTQLLREDIGTYNGNLYEAKEKWGQFEVSQYDWLKDVRIPINIGTDEATLLGIFFSQGIIFPPTRDRKKQSKVDLIGRNCDFDFYSYVADLIKEVHNIVPSEPGESRRLRMTKGNNKGYTYNQPIYEISSLALVSWLHKDLGMSYSREQRELPDSIKTKKQKRYFLKGVIGSLAHLYLYDEKSTMKMTITSSKFAEDIMKLSYDFELSPYLTKNGRVLNYSKKDILKMRKSGFFINSYLNSSF